MTSRTVRAEPRIETITPTRRVQLEAAITTVQAQDAEVTAAAVHRLVSGHRRTVQVYVKAWEEDQQQRAASPVAPAPVVPAAPPTPPVSRLVYLRELCAQLDADWEAMQRAHAQLQQQRAQTHADFRNGILEASRLTRRLRQAEMLATHPVSVMDPDAAPQWAQMRAELTALVGAAEVEAVLADPQYRPWWME